MNKSRQELICMLAKLKNVNLIHSFLLKFYFYTFLAVSAYTVVRNCTIFFTIQQLTNSKQLSRTVNSKALGLVKQLGSFSLKCFKNTKRFYTALSINKNGNVKTK